MLGINDEPESFADFKARVLRTTESLNQDQLADAYLKILSEPDVIADKLKFNLLASNIAVLQDPSRALRPLTLDEIAQMEAEAKARLAALQAQQRTQAIFAIEQKFQPPPSDPDWKDKLFGLGSAFTGSAFDILSLDASQIAQLDRGSLLRMAALKGVNLDRTEAAWAMSASIDQNELARIIRAGGGDLTSEQFSAIVAGGGGNLTIAQIVAAGGGNLLGQDGASISFKVVDKFGNVVANDGAGLTVMQLAKLLGQDGASLIGHDGSTIVAGGGGNIVAGGGGNIVAGGGGNIVAGGGGNIVAGGGGNIVAGGGGNVVANDGAGFMHSILQLIGHDGSTLIGLGDSSVQQAITNSMRNSPSSVLSHNGNAGVNPATLGLIGPNSATGLVTPTGVGLGLLPGGGTSIFSTGGGIGPASGGATGLTGGFSAGSNAVQIGR